MQRFHLHAEHAQGGFVLLEPLAEHCAAPPHFCEVLPVYLLEVGVDFPRPRPAPGIVHRRHADPSPDVLHQRRILGDAFAVVARFQTKPEIAVQQIGTALEREIPSGPVLANATVARARSTDGVRG